MYGTLLLNKMRGIVTTGCGNAEVIKMKHLITDVHRTWYQVLLCHCFVKRITLNLQKQDKLFP